MSNNSEDNSLNKSDKNILDKNSHYYSLPFYGIFVKPNNNKTKTRAFLLTSIRMFVIFAIMITVWNNTFDRNFVFVLLSITVLDLIFICRYQIKCNNQNRSI